MREVLFDLKTLRLSAGKSGLPPNRPTSNFRLHPHCRNSIGNALKWFNYCLQSFAAMKQSSKLTFRTPSTKKLIFQCKHRLVAKNIRVRFLLGTSWHDRCEPDRSRLMANCNQLFYNVLMHIWPLECSRWLSRICVFWTVPALKPQKFYAKSWGRHLNEKTKR